MAILSFIPAWVLVVLVLLVLIIILIRSSNNINVLYFIKANFFYFFLAGIFAFVAISIFYIHSTNEIDFSNKEGIFNAFSIYYNWLVGVFRNLAKATSYVIHQDWVPGNSTA